MGNEYLLEENFVKDSLIIGQNIFQNNLTTSIWNFDQEQLLITVDAILKEPSISGIQVFDEYHKVLVQKGDVINRKSQAVFLENGKENVLSYTTLYRHAFDLKRDNKKIGAVILYSNSKLIFDKVKYNFLFIIVNAIIKTIALWLLFVWAFNKFLTTQLDIFCQAMEDVDIDNQKNYAVNLDTFGTYELSRIEYFFNKLLQRIINSRDRLNELNKNLEQKVIERTEEIQAKKQKLELLNQEKDNFLAMAAHDLKNPLGNIQNLSYLIEKSLQSENNPEKILRYNKLISISSHNMIDIVKNFLDVAKIESETIKVDLTKFNLLSLLNSVIEENYPHAVSKNIVMNFEYHNEENYLINSDQFLLSQICSNIISNAVKYSPLSGTVTISLTKKANSFEIAVADQGKGFSLTDKEKLFTKFCRLNSKPTANESSTGLGLFIVKKLADLLNAKIDCESIENLGTTFRVDIPVDHKTASNS
jgi:signal transduction histidine kinase